MTNVNIIPVIILDCDLRSQSGIIQPFGRKSIPIIALSSKPNCPAFHSRYITEAILSPSLDDGEDDFIQFLIDLPHRGVLIYSSDPCAVAIARHQERLKESGYLLNITDRISLEATFDKWECYKQALSLEIPMAKSQLVENIDDILNVWGDFEKPVILKGTTLAGGLYYKLNHKNEIKGCWEKINKLVNSHDYATRKSRIMLQEWHQFDMTDNWSCETVFDQNSTGVGFFTVKRIRCSLNADGTHSSRLFSGYHEYCPEIIEHTKNILTAMKWKGFAHVEYFYVPSKKKFMLTEVNPRLPGYSYYPSVAGFDMAFYYYADLIGTPFTHPTDYNDSIYFESFHYPGDLNMSLVHIAKGNIPLWPFVFSYLQLLLPGKQKIIDPIRFDDPMFSIYTQLENIEQFIKKCSAYIKKRLFFWSTNK